VPPSPASWGSRREWAAGAALWLAGLVLGLASESVGFGWDDPRGWVPDLLVGLVFIGSAVYALPRSRATGTLLAATGFAWFFGNFSPAALYWHRGPLVHVVVSYPGGRTRSRLDSAAVVVGYAAAIVTPVWRDEWVALLLALGLGAVVLRGYLTAAGRARRDRLVALRVTLALVVAWVGGGVARLVVPAGNAVAPTLLAYQVVLCGVAVVLAARVRDPSASSVADLVVELGERRSGTPRDALARTLGDPMLEIGYWDPAGRRYSDAEGRTVTVPPAGAGRVATFVERDSAPFAVLVHDESVLGEPVLVEAVAAATRLAASNAALQREVSSQLVALAASRRRLLVAGDDERRRLEHDLHDGAEFRLAALGAMLRQASPRVDGNAAAHLERAEALLAETVGELRELALGLHPRALADGMAPALAALADHSPVDVEVTVPGDRLSEEVEAAVYFVCAEALANVAKHAAASRATVDVAVRSGRVVAEVADDGSGGADPGRGSGLRGLTDRVETLGGALTLASPNGGGTRLRVELPLDPRRR
jgi:signal transduction histidine kinase